jgi:hypothetical protein
MARLRFRLHPLLASIVWAALAACSSPTSKPGSSGGSPSANGGAKAYGGTNQSSGGAGVAQGGVVSQQGGASAGQAAGGLQPVGGAQAGGAPSLGGIPPAQGGTLSGQGGSGGINSVGGQSGMSSGGWPGSGGSGLPTGGVSSSTGGVSSSTGGNTSVGGTGGQAPATTGGTHTQAPRPPGDPASCGTSWALTEGVCCAQYCSNDDKSESCSGCGGPGSAQCQVVNHKGCESGQWPEVHAVGDSEPWHYSRSTHFGLTAAGACAFGLYGLCTTAYKFSSGYAAQCDAFCKAYPDLCKDPQNITLHGNFAAPQGNYYTQFWPSLPGDNDNYLSCGECYEFVRTQKDGTEYQPGDAGYTPPIVIQVVDSCPCAANSKWCCGSGRDHCGEVSDFKYGCQLPPSPPPPPVDHDPTTAESIHFDLSDIAMARLQSGTPDGAMPDGVIPTKYRRIPCPVMGNLYFWLQPNANEYYFALSVVNMTGLGAAARVEARLPNGTWVALQRNSNYTMSRPQERYGTWALPQNSGMFQLPVSIRVTDGGGRSVVAEGAIKSWTPADASLAGTYYIDSGVQF